MDTQPNSESGQPPEVSALNHAESTPGGVWPPSPAVDASQEVAAANIAARQRLYNIAVGQRNVLWAVLAAIGALFVFGGLQSAHTLEFVGITLFYGAAIYQMVAIYRLAKAFENLSPVLYIIACLMPCISLLALLHLVGKATNELTRNGIKVGLLGANPKSIMP